MGDFTAMGYMNTFESLLLLFFGIMTIYTILMVGIVFCIVRARVKPMADETRQALAINNAFLQKLPSEQELQIKQALTQLMSESELVKYLRDMKKEQKGLGQKGDSHVG